ncbi:MAG TPA: dTDP-4-dehydrorhamnose 3,5-epimerase family protein [Candidatus Dormibacteraeota bacterium]|nr:dTDP-4-dehydrorhamnose 3,5-epimerase family protein [Candidatus Dormibacteraeota bacterium]
MLPGVSVRDISKIVDERGFFAEIFRNDWESFLGEDRIVQTNLSLSFPGTIRAWHRHERGQVDYIVVVRGVMKIGAFDDRGGSKTRGEFSEIVASGERLQIVRIPGHYWHGTKTLGTEPSLTLYLVTRLYDPNNPDEQRRSWNDLTIIDPRTQKPFDWNSPPHK